MQGILQNSAGSCYEINTALDRGSQQVYIAVKLLQYLHPLASSLHLRVAIEQNVR